MRANAYHTFVSSIGDWPHRNSTGFEPPRVAVQVFRLFAWNKARFPPLGNRRDRPGDLNLRAAAAGKIFKNAGPDEKSAHVQPRAISLPLLLFLASYYRCATVLPASLYAFLAAKTNRKDARRSAIPCLLPKNQWYQHWRLFSNAIYRSTEHQLL